MSGAVALGAAYTGAQADCVKSSEPGAADDGAVTEAGVEPTRWAREGGAGDWPIVRKAPYSVTIATITTQRLAAQTLVRRVRARL